jgi:hypothetical protein
MKSCVKSCCLNRTLHELSEEHKIVDVSMACNQVVCRLLVHAATHPLRLQELPEIRLQLLEPAQINTIILWLLLHRMVRTE